MILALLIFNIAFLVTYSQQEKGWPKQKDYNCPKCDFFFIIIFVMGQSKKPITKGKKWVHPQLIN